MLSEAACKVAAAAPAGRLFGHDWGIEQTGRLPRKRDYGKQSSGYAERGWSSVRSHVRFLLEAPGQAAVPSHFQFPLAAGALVQAPVCEAPFPAGLEEDLEIFRLWPSATNFAGSYDQVDSDQALGIDPLTAALGKQGPGT